MSIQKFQFNSSITEQELKKVETESSGPKLFEPGTYDLKIIDAVLNKTDRNPTGVSSGDPTWLVVKLTLGGIDSRTIFHYLLVPTVSDLYKKPGMKNPRLMFTKFREFIRGIGKNADVSCISNILNEYFADPLSLVGQSVSVVIGFSGPHTKYDPETKTISILDRDEKKKLINDEFSDRDSATIAAAELGLELKNFPEVRRFLSKENPKQELHW